MPLFPAFIKLDACAGLEADHADIDRLLIEAAPRESLRRLAVLVAGKHRNHARVCQSAGAGDSTGAAELIAATPKDCYLCARIGGRIAALTGNGVEAQRQFADAIAQAPALPQGYVDRGNASLASGDYSRALKDAEQTTR